MSLLQSIATVKIVEGGYLPWQEAEIVVKGDIFACLPDGYKETLKARLDAHADHDFYWGDGPNQPQGFMNDGGIGVTARDYIGVDEIVELLYSLEARFRQNATFVMNHHTASHIRSLKDEDGRFIYQSARAATEPDRLLGFPVLQTPHMPFVSTWKPSIAVGDFAQGYVIRTTGHFTFSLSFDTDARTVTAKAMARTDGEVALKKAIKLLKMNKPPNYPTVET